VAKPAVKPGREEKSSVVPSAKTSFSILSSRIEPVLQRNPIGHLRERQAWISRILDPDDHIVARQLKHQVGCGDAAGKGERIDAAVDMADDRS